MPLPPPATPARPLTRRDALLALAVAALTAAVYAPSVGFDFVNFDDNEYVYANPHVLEGPTGENVAWAFATVAAANWHPLTWVSLQLDAAAWGGDPAGYHLTNLLLHAANAALVFLIFRRATGAVGRSVAVAALWGLHPQHVESVAWVSERKDVLSLFLGLLAVWFHVRYAEAPSRRRSLPVMICTALGLLAKPMLVTLPFALLLLDFWPLGRVKSWADFVAVAAEKAYLFLLVFLSCGATFYAQTWGGAVRGLHEVSAADRAGGAAVAVAAYLGQTAWPAGLSVYYPLVRDRPEWQPVLAATFVVALTLGAWRLRRPAPYLLVGWLWFLGTLVPVIGLVHVGHAARADRYVYLPHVGLLAALVWGAADLLARLRVPPAARGVVAAAVAAAAGVVAERQLAHWRDGGTLWAHSVAVDPDNAYAWLGLGRYHYHGRGERDEAVRCLDEALRADPDNFEATCLRIKILVEQGKLKW